MKREQLGQLILASEDSMYHVAKSLLYNDADCQDAIQETIAKAFDKIGTLKQDTYAKTWLPFHPLRLTARPDFNASIALPKSISPSLR